MGYYTNVSEQTYATVITVLIRTDETKFLWNMGTWLPDYTVSVTADTLIVASSSDVTTKYVAGGLWNQQVYQEMSRETWLKSR